MNTTITALIGLSSYYYRAIRQNALTKFTVIEWDAQGCTRALAPSESNPRFPRAVHIRIDHAGFETIECNCPAGALKMRCRHAAVFARLRYPELAIAFHYEEKEAYDRFVKLWAYIEVRGEDKEHRKRELKRMAHKWAFDIPAFTNLRAEAGISPKRAKRRAKSGQEATIGFPPVASMTLPVVEDGSDRPLMSPTLPKGERVGAIEL